MAEDKAVSKKCRTGVFLYIGIMLTVIFLNILAWNSEAFCDAYIAYVFPVWVNTYGRFTGLFSFSVGEWLIMAGVLLVLLAILLMPTAVLAGILQWKRWKCFLKRFYCFLAWTVLIVWLVMTLNCFILYHASTFSETYFGEDTGEYTLEEVLQVRNYVVEQCNRLSREVARDENGVVTYEETLSADGALLDMEDRAREAMQQLGKRYSQLDGWYPRPKAMMFSDFMCQQYMQGYYFPFSMEANYNDVMTEIRKPATMCHELAHLRGYIYEDEANFISYLACTQSEDIYFQYSGYLSVLNYLENDLYYAIQNNFEAYKEAVSTVKPLSVYRTVREDNIFVSDEEWERINAKAWMDTETVDEISDVFVDTTLKANGVSDGMVSYSRVVRLLMQYYRIEGNIFE